MGGFVLMINIELNDKYFEIAKETIKNHNLTMQ